MNDNIAEVIYRYHLVSKSKLLPYYSIQATISRRFRNAIIFAIFGWNLVTYFLDVTKNHECYTYVLFIT